MKTTLLLATLSLLPNAYAYEAQLTKGQLTPSLEALLEKASADSGVSFDATDFIIVEKRELATSNYSMYIQTTVDVPVADTAVRIWSYKKTDQMILAEMHLDESHKEQEKSLSLKFLRAKFSKSALKSKQLSRSILQVVTDRVGTHPTDSRIIGMKLRDQWVKGDLVRKVEVRSRRGLHIISISLFQKKKIVKESYNEFPQADFI